MKRNVVLCLLTLLSVQVFAQKQSQVVDKIICICSVLLEPLVLPFARGWFTFIMIILVSVFTVWSGLNYILTYWKYLDATK